MLMRNFSQTQKKQIRALINLGLNREYQNGLGKIETVIAEWKNGTRNDRESYMQLFKVLQPHDRQIAERYNGLRVAQYDLILSLQLAEGLVSEEELAAGVTDEDLRRELLQSKANLLDQWKR